MVKDLILNTRLWAYTALAIFVLMVGMSVAGQLLASRLQGDPAAYRSAGIFFKGLALLLVFGLAWSLAPLMVRGVLGVQERLGNGEVPIVAFLLRHEAAIVLGFWGLWLAGALVAAPYVVRDFILGE